MPIISLQAETALAAIALIKSNARRQAQDGAEK